MTDTSPIDYEVKQMSEFCAVRGRSSISYFLRMLSATPGFPSGNDPLFCEGRQRHAQRILLRGGKIRH
jgi:hypothetical protein